MQTSKYHIGFTTETNLLYGTLIQYITQQIRVSVTEVQQVKDTKILIHWILIRSY